MREKENARFAQGSFIERLIDEALLEFNTLEGNAPLDAALFVPELQDRDT